MIMAFLLGFALDSFHHNPGFHAASCVLIAYVRPFIINIMIPHEGAETNYEEPSLKSMGGFMPYMIYAGVLTLLHNTFPGFNAGNPNKPNSYSLYGMGIGLLYGRPGDWLIRGSVAWKLGSNPGRDANGKDSDGGNSHARAWIQFAKFF